MEILSSHSSRLSNLTIESQESNTLEEEENPAAEEALNPPSSPKVPQPPIFSKPTVKTYSTNYPSIIHKICIYIPLPLSVMLLFPHIYTNIWETLPQAVFPLINLCELLFQNKYSKSNKIPHLIVLMIPISLQLIMRNDECIFPLYMVLIFMSIYAAIGHIHVQILVIGHWILIQLLSLLYLNYVNTGSYLPSITERYIYTGINLLGLIVWGILAVWVTRVTHNSWVEMILNQRSWSNAASSSQQLLEHLQEGILLVNSIQGLILSNKTISTIIGGSQLGIDEKSIIILSKLESVDQEISIAQTGVKDNILHRSKNLHDHVVDIFTMMDENPDKSVAWINDYYTQPDEQRIMSDKERENKQRHFRVSFHSQDNHQSEGHNLLMVVYEITYRFKFKKEKEKGILFKIYLSHLSKILKIVSSTLSGFLTLIATEFDKYEILIHSMEKSIKTRQNRKSSGGAGAIVLSRMEFLQGRTMEQNTQNTQNIQNIQNTQKKSHFKLPNVNLDQILDTTEGMPETPRMNNPFFGDFTSPDKEKKTQSHIDALDEILQIGSYSEHFLSFLGSSITSFKNLITTSSRAAFSPENIPSTSQFSLSELIDEIQSMFSLQLKIRGINLKIDKDSHISSFVGEREKIKIILIHLLQNSLSYTLEGSIQLSIMRVGKAKKIDKNIRRSTVSGSLFSKGIALVPKSVMEDSKGLLSPLVDIRIPSLVNPAFSPLSPDSQSSSSPSPSLPPTPTTPGRDKVIADDFSEPKLCFMISDTGVGFTPFQLQETNSFIKEGAGYFAKFVRETNPDFGEIFGWNIFSKSDNYSRAISSHSHGEGPKLPF